MSKLQVVLVLTDGALCNAALVPISRLLSFFSASYGVSAVSSAPFNEEASQPVSKCQVSQEAQLGSRCI